MSLPEAAFQPISALSQRAKSDGAGGQTASHELDPAPLAASLRETILNRAPSLLDRKPVGRYILLLDSAPPASYADLGPEVARWCAEILDSFGEDTAGLYHQLVLVTLIQNVEKRGSSYPALTHAMLLKELGAILDEMAGKPASKYLMSNSAFRQDLAICAQRLIPCGVVTVDVNAGVPRRWLLVGGAANGLRVAAFIVRKMGSFRPVYEMHLHRRALVEFTPAGWEAAYRRIAALLEMNPSILGVFGSSWWYDPKVAALTPRLSFLRDIPLANGAGIFPMGEDADSRRDALANSPQRRRLYDCGMYKPARYLLLWGRKDILRWAQSLKALAPPEA